MAAEFETQLPAEHITFFLNGAMLLPTTPISVLRDGDQIVISPRISWWQQQHGQESPLLLGAPDSAQPQGSAPQVGSAAAALLQLPAPGAAAPVMAAAAAPVKAAGKADVQPAARAAPLKGRQTKRAERMPNGQTAGVSHVLMQHDAANRHTETNLVW